MAIVPRPKACVLLHACVFYVTLHLAQDLVKHSVCPAPARGKQKNTQNQNVKCNKARVSFLPPPGGGGCLELQGKKPKSLMNNE
jgi:hypothetical protein